MGANFSLDVFKEDVVGYAYLCVCVCVCVLMVACGWDWRVLLYICIVFLCR